jgi:integrase
VRKKRAHGEGSIFQDSRGYWVGDVTLPSGKRKRKYAKTQKAVKDWLQSEREAIKSGLWIGDEKITISELLDRYFNDVAVHTLRPKTIESYESIIRLHLKPEIGNVKLSALTPAHLQTLYSNKIQSGLSKRTVQYIHAVIHRALKQALKWGLTVRNVADAVDAPKVKKTAPTTLTQAQIASLLDAADGWLKTILVLAITTGMRQGELLGLHWEDISGSEIHVRHTTQTLYKKGIVISEPKTDRGKRTITLPEIAVKALQEYQQVMSDKTGLVFHTSTGKPISARNLIRGFQTVLEKAGLPHIRFHDLRHTSATLLLIAGVHPKVVQERLGHSRIDMTLDTYSHVVPSLQEDAAEKMNKLFVAKV